MKRYLLTFAALLLIGCAEEKATAPEPEAAPPAADQAPPAEASSSASNATNAYFGDLHVHTVYSMDAYTFGTRATPDDAYRFAKGESLTHPAGFEMQLEDPLDFYAVTDHGFYLGILRAMGDPDNELSKHPDSKLFTNPQTLEERNQAFLLMREYLSRDSEKFREIEDMPTIRAAWSDIIETANRHNKPGEFTTFIGYEYTSGPESNNLHRNVIFNADKGPDAPFSRLDSQNPEDLWQWMDGLRDEGIESLAIPHNMNGSNGQMFSLTYFDSDKPLDAAYAELRMRNEPIVENTQVKGTSDTHPLLSPNDEWADFEIFPYRIATWLDSDPDGSYVRQAWLNGTRMEAEQGFNPFKFGVIGSSDTHNASWSGNDENYYSKVGLRDASPVLRGSVPLAEPDEEGNKYHKVYYNLWGGSGLAAVWAEENTRESIYAAFRRKETFSTTGPRIKVRFFAGSELPALDDKELVNKAYASGVTMGGDLEATEESPEFLLWATRDTRAQKLQRMQIIKGWIEDGEAKELVYDVACSYGLPNPATGRCPDNGARVDVADCSVKPDVGAAELKAKWKDPDFDSSQAAFYYVRVLQNPTCRWSTWDAMRAGVMPRPDTPWTIQERAWSSPIWYTPASES
jgi:hypothetical protein